MKYAALIVAFLLPSVALQAQEHPKPQVHESQSSTITRIDAMNVANAIATIGEYKCENSGQAGICYMKASVETRSRLHHDLAILVPINRETQTALLPNSSLTDTTKMGEQKVPVFGLQMITEADLQLGDNPQITPSLEFMLAPIMKDSAAEKFHQ